MEDDEKEAYRLFWLVKGHLNTSHETIISSYDGYFKRHGVTVNVLNTVWKASKKHIKRKGVDFFLNWCYNIGTIEKELYEIAR